MNLPWLCSLAWLARFTLLVRASTLNLALRGTALPTPIAVSPSENWDGDDGPWSSFTLRLGSPEQNVRAFVSTNSPDTFVVVPGGCAASDSNCLDERGQTFNPNTSSTWSEYGYFEISIEQNLNLSAQAVYGNETVGLGIQGSGGPTLQNQIVGAYASNDFYLGLFGVNPASTNFTAAEQGRPSYISTLNNQGLIPSLSFGYTAGNQYRLKQVPGSLVLGGYDSSRFTPSNLSFPLAPDSTRSLMVGIQSITSTDSKGSRSTLLPTGIMSLIDSTASQIWLPLEACQAFEKAFGLTFDESTQLYLVDSDLHTELLAQNASVTFTLGAATTGGQTVNITLPYASFDLLVQPPFPSVVNSTRYFPLRRAASDSQYTLGRTFLQEAYLTVDWARHNFSISQCAFADDMQQTLVSILSANDTERSAGSGGHSTGKTVGIAVGVVVGVLLIMGIVGAFFFKSWWTGRKQRSKQGGSGTTSPEVQTSHVLPKGELDTAPENQRFEMPGSNPPVAQTARWDDEKARRPRNSSGINEADGGNERFPELGSQNVPGRGLHEIGDSQSQPLPKNVSGIAELPAGLPELPGSGPGSPTHSSPHPAIPAPVPSQKPKRRSFREKFTGKSVASRSSALTSVSGQASNPTPPLQPRQSYTRLDRSANVTPPANEPFSPVSRQGTFTPDNSSMSSPRMNPMLSPVSPDGPSRRLFDRPRGPDKQYS